MIAHSKPTLSSLDNTAILNCLNTSMISRSTLVDKFEDLLRLYLDTEYVKLTVSGTTAIFLALRVLKISDKNQEVLIPTYVCPSVEEAVVSCGATPVFYDNNVEWTSGLNPIRSKITERTAAILVVHTLGITLECINEIVGLNIPVIEDVCQAFGGELNGVKLGNFGDIGIYSFHATKCLTTGEGGALSTRSPELARAIESEYKKMRGLFAMSDINAALGINQLQQYPFFLQDRAGIAHKYFQAFPEWSTSAFNNFSSNNIFFRFLLKMDGTFDLIREQFSERGISIRKGVDTLLHRAHEIDDDNFPNSVHIYSKTISLPIYPSLTGSEINTIIVETNKILSCYES